MENSKVITSIPHDHEKESRNNAVEKFRKVLTKKATEKPNKPLVDIYLEETLNHSEASILYPFTQAESTMRKARSKNLEDKRKIEEERTKNEEEMRQNEEKSETEKIYEENLLELSKSSGSGSNNKDKIQTTLTQIDDKFTKMDKLETEMQNSEYKYRKFEHQTRNFEGSMHNFDEKLQNIEKKLYKIQEKREKIEGKSKKVEATQTSTSKTHHHQKYFYIENINENTQIILMNQGTLGSLGKIEEIHIDLGMKVDVRDAISTCEAIGSKKKMKNIQTSHNIDEKCTGDLIADQTPNPDQNIYNPCQELSDLPQMSFLDQNFTYTSQEPVENYENISLVYQNFNQTENSQIIQTIEFSACSSTENYFHDTYLQSKEVNTTSEPFYVPKSDEHQPIDIDYVVQHDPQAMSIDFGVEKQPAINYNEMEVDFGEKGTTDFTFGQSGQEVTPTEEFMDQTQYYQEFLVSCDENSDNSSQNLMTDRQVSIMSGESSQKIGEMSKISSFGDQASDEPNFSEKSTKTSKKSTTNPDTSKHNLKIMTNRYQILTIIALVKGKDCPIAIGILKSKKCETIQHFLNFLKLKISLNPSIILTSQDQTIQKCINDIWPESTIKIMYFYYAQSILKNLQKNYTEISKNIFEISSLKMVLSMPLIPTNYVIPGWEALRKWMNEKNVDLNSLCDDVYNKWLAENAERISIFNGLTHSINNHTQVFQSELINSFEAVPMKSEILVDKISRQATKNFIKFTKTNESSANKTQKLQKTVKIATKSWISSPFHLRRPIQFLQQVSHCIDDGMINFVMNFDGDFCETKKLEPPPLIFFEKEGTSGEKRGAGKKKKQVSLSSEPPPLVPIRR